MFFILCSDFLGTFLKAQISCGEETRRSELTARLYHSANIMMMALLILLAKVSVLVHGMYTMEVMMKMGMMIIMKMKPINVQITPEMGTREWPPQFSFTKLLLCSHYSLVSLFLLILFEY